MERKRLTQAEKREATREEILAAASRVFADRGYHAASLDSIAEEAGFSRGAVYYNFADKEELFLELLDRRCAERAEDMREVFTGDTDDLEATSQQAQIASTNAFDALTGDAEFRALYFEFLAQAARDAATRRRLAKRCADMRSALDEVVAERTAPIADTLPMETEQLAIVFDALSTGLWAHHMLHGSKAVPPDLFAKAIALMVDGIAARAGIAPAEGITA